MTKQEIKDIQGPILVAEEYQLLPFEQKSGRKCYLCNNLTDLKSLFCNDCTEALQKIIAENKKNTKKVLDVSK